MEKKITSGASRNMRRNPAIEIAVKLAAALINVCISRPVLYMRVLFIRHPVVSNFLQPLTGLVRDSQWAKNIERARIRWLDDVLGQADPAPLQFAQGKPLVVLVIGTLGAGGSERQVVNTAIGLQESEKVRVTVLCQTLVNPADRYFVNDLESRSIEVRELTSGIWMSGGLSVLENPVKRGMIGFSRTDVAQIRAYAAEFERLSPAVVHAWLDEINVKAGIGAVLGGVPRVLLSCRSVAPFNFVLYKRYMYPGYRALLDRRNVRLVCNSVAGRSSYARWLCIPEQNVAVIRNGFPKEFFESAPRNEVENWILANELDSARKIVGTVTRFNEEKNPFLWVKFAAQLADRDPGIQFVMMGGGPLLERARRYAKRAGLGERIKFTGLSRATRAAIGAFDVFVFTSRLEGLPNAVIEAQAGGVPVVMTKAGGSPEAIVPGVTGIVVDNADPQAIADATWRVLSERDWRDGAREKAAQFARNTFSLADMSKHTLSLYEC